MRFRKRLLSGLIAGILVYGNRGNECGCSKDTGRSADSGGRSRQCL